MSDLCYVLLLSDYGLIVSGRAVAWVTEKDPLRRLQETATAAKRAALGDVDYVWAIHHIRNWKSGHPANARLSESVSLILWSIMDAFLRCAERLTTKQFHKVTIEFVTADELRAAQQQVALSAKQDLERKAAKLSREHQALKGSLEREMQNLEAREKKETAR